MTVHRFHDALSPFAAGHRGAPSKAIADASRREAPFIVNGRFLTQRMTGVQRYGLEILRCLADQAHSSGQSIPVMLPPQASIPPGLHGVNGVHVGVCGGHLWEQTILPWPRRPLLNLCNTAPIFRKRQIVCIHDANVFEIPESYARPFRAYYKILHPMLARSGSVIVTVSNHSADRIAAHTGLARDQIIVAPNGHEHALRWKPERSTIAAPPTRPYVMLLGSLARHKNVKLILALAPELDELGLDICVAGASAGAFAATDFPRHSNVRFLGCVSDDDLAFLLQNALCLAFPSRCEGFGIPMLEAMVWNCPIVASSASCLPEVGGDACLYAHPDSGREWLEHFTTLVRTPERSDDLRRRGAIRAKTFSWQASASIYQDLFRHRRMGGLSRR